MKRLLPLLLLSASLKMLAQPTQATLLGNWLDESIVKTTWLNSRFNEVWGFAINCHEYGVIGSTEGMHIIDVTDPTNPTEVFFVQGADTGPDLVHRDFKEYRGYLYCVADEGLTSALQIIDLHDLPNSVTQVYNSNEFVTQAHNLFIDTSQAKLYLLGRGSTTRVLDISNPTKPGLLATYPMPGFNLPYVHDAYIRDNIGIMNCGFDGLWVVDFTNPALPVQLGTMTNYPEWGYNHSGWLSTDGKYYFLCDETHGKSIKVVDMSDYKNLKVVATLNPGSWAGQIPHNCLLRDDLLYVSYYYDGLQVFDVSDPLNPLRVAYYDTYPDPNETFYAGSWGVYPLLPSGNILLSDMQYGFFVFEALPGSSGKSLVPSKTRIEGCVGKPVTMTLKVGEGFSSEVSMEASGNVPGELQFSQNPAPPGSTVEVTFDNFVQGDYVFSFQASDNQGGAAKVCMLLTAGYAPALPAPYLLFPENDATEVDATVNFDWKEAAEAQSYLLQLSTEEQNFEDHLIHSVLTTQTSEQLSGLDSATTYFWRVIAVNGCGTAGEEPIFKFTTVSPVVAAEEWQEDSITIFPNPAARVLHVVFKNAVSDGVRLELFSMTGGLILQNRFDHPQRTFSIETDKLPAGTYQLRLVAGNTAMMKKIVIQR